MCHLGGKVGGHFISGMIPVSLYSCWISIQSLGTLDPGEGERTEGLISLTGRAQVWYCFWVVSESDGGDSCLRDRASCTKSF